MQETCASPPNFDPPLEAFRKLYNTWSSANYGLLITGQVQIDSRYFSIAGDVCCHEDSLSELILSLWREWASIAQKYGTPCIVQLAHPGRMSPAGAGNRLADMPALCPSSLPVKIGMGEGWLDKLALDKLLGTPKAMTLEEIDEVVEMFLNGARVAKEAGFAGVQIHGAHGFLVSEFLSPHTNRRNDAYGGDPERRMTFLKRLVKEIREILSLEKCLSVKLYSGDYMDPQRGGLTQDEALEQVRWLVECGMVDFVEISGGNAEQKTSKLQNSFGGKSLEKAPKRESTRIREAAFTEFAERVEKLQPRIPIQLSGGFRSRNGMADADDQGTCDLIGLGRTAVLEPQLPKDILLNPDIPDDEALALPHQIRGMWLSRYVPAKVVGGGLPIQESIPHSLN
jgi:2,4-dienoyl-CoA reductase-like NADH-dependent reductase (Old Yellow Enzyme family)